MKQKKGNSNLILLGFAALLLLLTLPGQGRAQELSVLSDYQFQTNDKHRRTVDRESVENLPGCIHVGPLQIHPGLSVEEQYTDNLFLEERGKKGSWITNVSPGIVLLLPLRRHSLQLDYHAEIIEASRFHKQYDTDSHFVNAILNLDFNRLNIQAGDNWESDSTMPLDEMDTRNDYIQNRVFCDMSYRFATRYTAKVFYRNISREFDEANSEYDAWIDPEWDNYTENDMGGSLYYRFMPKTSVLFEYGFTHHNQTDRGLPGEVDRDSDTQRYWGGLMWEPTAKLAGTIKGGYTKKDYEGNSESWSGFGFEGSLDYKFRSRDTFTLSGFRYPIETSINETRMPGPDFAPGVYGTYSVTTGGTLAWKHRFTYRISGIADVSYFNDDYSEEGSWGKKREDNRVAAGIGVLYQIRDWLGLNLRYHYQDNDSNAPDESYRENLFTGIFSLKF